MPGGLQLCASGHRVDDRDNDADRSSEVRVLGAVFVAVVTFVAFEWFGDIMSRLPAKTTGLLARIGGLLLATIGVQMLLGGLKNFFAG